MKNRVQRWLRNSTVRVGPDGELIVEPRWRTRATVFVLAAFFAVFWNGVVGGCVASLLGLSGTPFHFNDVLVRPGTTLYWISWVFLVPFVAVGVALLALVVYSLGRSSWRADAGGVEKRWTLLGWTRVSRFPDGRLALTSIQSEGGGTTWILRLHARGKEETVASGSAEETAVIGRLVAGRTGWPLKVPPDVEHRIREDLELVPAAAPLARGDEATPSSAGDSEPGGRYGGKGSG